MLEVQVWHVPGDKPQDAVFRNRRCVECHFKSLPWGYPTNHEEGLGAVIGIGSGLHSDKLHVKVACSLKRHPLWPWKRAKFHRCIPPSHRGHRQRELVLFEYGDTLFTTGLHYVVVKAKRCEASGHWIEFFRKESDLALVGGIDKT